MPESKLFPKVYPRLLNTDVKSVLGGPCQTVEAHRMSSVRNILVLLPCLSTSAYNLSTAGWAQQVPGWPNISLGTSLLSWGELFFFWHIFSKQSIRERDLYCRKLLLNTDLFNMLRLHWLSYLWPLTKYNALHGTVTGDLPSFLNYDLHLPPLSHEVVTYCNKDLGNKSLLINLFL